MNDSAIRCEGLSKYFGDTPALQDLDLSIPAGTIFGFLGPNGAGKTTTLKILTGLSKPSRGRAWVGGEQVAPNSVPLQSKIGYLPEEPAYYGWMTGIEYLSYVGEIFGQSQADIRKRSSELLDLVDLAEAAKRRISGYSRGMRQRLGIAQALMNQPRVLFLDEPSSALDPFGRLEVLETLTRFKGQGTTTIFLSSHILADVERVCDVVGIIDKGKLVVEAGVEDLRRRFARSVFIIEFEEPSGAFEQSVRNEPWVERVVTEEGIAGPRLAVHASDPAVAKRELPKLVAGSGLTLLRYETVLPSLEEVFMEIVGRRE